MTATIEKVGSRVYAVNAPFSLKDSLKRIGCHWDADRRQWWIGASKASEMESLIAGANAPVDPNAPKPKQDPHDIRLTGKGRYKGREYFAGSITRDGQKVRLLTLPDDKGDYLDFWALCSEVEKTKTYTPRERWNGRRGGGTVTVYTTLGSIADFVKEQKQAKAAGVPECPVCGKRNDNMVHDLETGMTCCRGCADMPSDEY